MFFCFAFAKTDYVAFLDVRTVPLPSWFDSLSYFVQDNNFDLQLGSVIYFPTSFFAEVFIVATYGFTPLDCLPGSILSVNTFTKIGHFLPTRSAEDSEWLQRAKFLNLKIRKHHLPPLLQYRIGLSGFSLVRMLRKWFRNYIVSFSLPGYQVHKYLYILFAFLIVLLVFSSWNWRIARWEESSWLYLPYVTRLLLILAMAAYVVFRAFYLPISNGVLLRRHYWILLLFSFPLAVLFDFVKVFAGFRVLCSSLFRL